MKTKTGARKADWALASDQKSAIGKRLQKKRPRIFRWPMAIPPLQLERRMFEPDRGPERMLMQCISHALTSQGDQQEIRRLLPP
jgi:hypothetical protein